MKELKIVFNPLIFPDHTWPFGFLPDNMGAQACWWVYVTGMKRLQDVGRGPESQIILENELWLDTHFVQQKRSAALIYGLESPEILDRYWEPVIKEAIRMGYPEPVEALIKASPMLIESTNQLRN